MDSYCKSRLLLQRLENFVKTTDHGVFGLLFGAHREGKAHVVSSCMGINGKPQELEEAVNNFQDLVQGRVS